MAPGRALIGAAAFCVVVMTLRELKSVLMPFSFALLFFYLADPLVDAMARWKLPRPAGILFVLLAAAAALGGAGMMAAHAGGKLKENAPKYREKLEKSLGPQRAEKARAQGEKLKESGGQMLAGVGGAAGGLLLLFAFASFLLVESPRARLRWKHAFPGHVAEIVKTLDLVQERMGTYIRVQTAVSAFQAGVFFVILFAHGAELAAFWALLNFVSQFIPNIGPVVTSIPPVLAMMAQEDASKALSMAGWVLASQFLIGNFLEPRIVGHGVRLDAISVLLGIVFFGWLWGVGGAFLAVPILLFVKTVCENVPGLRPVAGLLTGTEKATRKS